MGKFNGEQAEPFCPSTSQIYVVSYSRHHFEVLQKEVIFFKDNSDKIVIFTL